MAPDLNTLESRERWDYSTPGSGGYTVPDIVYNVRRIFFSSSMSTDDLEGSLNPKAEGRDYWSWLVGHSDGIPDPETHAERRACYI